MQESTDTGFAGSGNPNADEVERFAPGPEAPRAVRKGRPPKAEPYRSFVAKLLVDQPAMSTSDLLQRARLLGYGGGKSAFYALVARVRTASPSVHRGRCAIPGVRSEHDFGPMVVTFADGSKRRIHLFTSRLSYSRWILASVIARPDIETTIRALVGHLATLGGVPLVTAFERPLPRCGQELAWTAALSQTALELGVAVEIARPAPPRRGSLAWIRRAFLRGRRFRSDGDLCSQLADFVRDVNNGAILAREAAPCARFAEDRARLRPLPLAAEELGLRLPVAVRPPGLVDHDGAIYLVPPTLVGSLGTLIVYPARLEIQIGDYRSSHPRARTS